MELLILLHLLLSASLDFWRFVDRSIDNNEYLKVEVSGDNGVTWSELCDSNGANCSSWTDGQGDDDEWNQESFDLSSYLTSTEFQVRFIAKASSAGEDLQIDDVQIVRHADTPPELTPISDVTFSEGFRRLVDVSATPTNGDSITLSLTSSPSWASIQDNGDGTGRIILNIPNEVDNTRYNVTVEATDNDGSDRDTFRVNITEVNQDPVFLFD